MHRSIPALALFLAMTGTGAAAELVKTDDDMIRLCRAELEDRLFAGAAHGETFITAQDVKRDADRAVIGLALASGEGRTLAATCIFRDGRLFDVK